MKIVNVGIVASILPHIFCCGVPIVLSLVGLIAPESAHFEIIPEWLEPWMFVASAGLLGFSWVMVMRECRCACNHCHGDNSHRVQRTILTVVTILFIASVLLHIVAHNA